MFDLVIESIAIYHLPVTVLLGLCLLFWVGVILGALDIDIFNFDLDLDFDGELDLDMDVDVDIEGELDGADASALGLLGTFLRFVNAHKVPTMVVVTIFATCVWAIALYGNVIFNPGEPFERSINVAMLLLIPNVIASVFLTKLISTPLGRVFDSLELSGEKHLPVIGRIGIVKTATVTNNFGQVEVSDAGAPILIEARVAEGAEPISKGESVLVVQNVSDKALFIVRPN